jgi:hypothetical protein
LQTCKLFYRRIRKARRDNKGATHTGFLGAKTLLREDYSMGCHRVMHRHRSPKSKCALQCVDLCYTTFMRRSIFRIGEMSATEKIFFVVSFAGMFLAFIFDFAGFLEKKLSRIFFSLFLGVFVINWLVILLRHRRKN